MDIDRFELAVDVFISEEFQVWVRQKMMNPRSINKLSSAEALDPFTVLLYAMHHSKGDKFFSKGVSFQTFPQTYHGWSFSLWDEVFTMKSSRSDEKRFVTLIPVVPVVNYELYCRPIAQSVRMHHISEAMLNSMMTFLNISSVQAFFNVTRSFDSLEKYQKALHGSSFFPVKYHSSEGHAMICIQHENGDVIILNNSSRNVAENSYSLGSMEVRPEVLVHDASGELLAEYRNFRLLERIQSTGKAYKQAPLFAT